MKRFFSLAQHTVPMWNPAEMIYNAADIGYQAVGIRAIPQGASGECVYRLSDPDIYREAEKAIKDKGVLIHDIDLVAIRNTTQVMDYKHEIEAASALGVSGVVCSIWTKDEAHALTQLNRLCGMAAEHGMLVHLEFVTWSGVKTLAEATRILRQLDKPNLRILLDMLHVHRSKVSVEEINACPAGIFELVHLCDAPLKIPTQEADLISTARTQRLYPGEGAIPVAAILAAIRDEDLVLGIEIPHQERWRTRGAFEHAVQSLRRSQIYLESGDI